MGRSIIIKDADFSANGIGVVVDPMALVPSGWTNSTAIYSNSSTQTFGNTTTSSQFKLSDAISIPQAYRGGTLQYTRCIFTTSAGKQSGYGLVFFNSSNEPVAGDMIPMGTRGVEVVETTIPDNAASFRVSYFMDTETPFAATAYPPED